MDEYITIRIAEYHSLLRDRAFLHSLEDTGVTNWEGYMVAIVEYNVSKIELPVPKGD